MSITGRFDEEVNVRWTHAVAAHAMHQPFRTAAWRATVPAGHDRTEPITALGVGLYPASQIKRRLRGPEEGIIAHRVGVPYFDRCVRHGRTLEIANLALHEQYFAVIGAVVDPRFVFADRRTRHIKR